MSVEHAVQSVFAIGQAIGYPIPALQLGGREAEVLALQMPYHQTSPKYPVLAGVAKKQ